MTTFLDTSAILALVTDCRERAAARSALAVDSVWTASALALTEALPAIDRMTDEEVVRDDLEDEVRRLWDHLHVVPVDQICLDRAAVLARSQPVRLADGLHLAAAERLPRPVSYVTFDPAQITVAGALGFDVVST